MAERLVLWDVDHTLINAGGWSSQLYGLVFAELFGRELPQVAPMAGRTDRAIIVETLTMAEVPDPRQHVPAFIAAMARQAPAYGERVRARGRVLPGVVYNDEGRGAFPALQRDYGKLNAEKMIQLGNSIPIKGGSVVNVVYDATALQMWVTYAHGDEEAYQRPSTPLSILALRNRLLLPKVRAFVDFLQQHWMHPRSPL